MKDPAWHGLIYVVPPSREAVAGAVFHAILIHLDPRSSPRARDRIAAELAALELLVNRVQSNRN